MTYGHTIVKDDDEDVSTAASTLANTAILTKGSNWDSMFEVPSQYGKWVIYHKAIRKLDKEMYDAYTGRTGQSVERVSRSMHKLNSWKPTYSASRKYKF